ncbi:MAG: hypothetical protein WCS99_02275 [Limisphaerales bacterium]
MPTNIAATAVLSVQMLLPVLQDCVRKCEIDMPKPVAEYEITHEQVVPSLNKANLEFEGRFYFSWFAPHKTPYYGSFSFLDGEHHPESVNNRDRLPEYTNRPSLLTTNQALRIAERALQRSGLSDRMAAMRPPVSSQYFWGPPGRGGSPLPFFVIRWYPKKPLFGFLTGESFDEEITVHVSGLNKRVSGMEFGPYAWQQIDLTKYYPHLTNSHSKPRPVPAPEKK